MSHLQTEPVAQGTVVAPALLHWPVDATHTPFMQVAAGSVQALAWIPAVFGSVSYPHEPPRAPVAAAYWLPLEQAEVAEWVVEVQYAPGALGGMQDAIIAVHPGPATHMLSGEAPVAIWKSFVTQHSHPRQAPPVWVPGEVGEPAHPLFG